MDWYISLIDENNIELAFIDYKHESIPNEYRLPNSGLLLNFEVDNVDDVYNRLKQDKRRSKTIFKIDCNITKYYKN